MIRNHLFLKVFFLILWYIENLPRIYYLYMISQWSLNNTNIGLESLYMTLICAFCFVNPFPTPHFPPLPPTPFPFMSFRIISSRTGSARPLMPSEKPSIIALNLMKNILLGDLEHSSENWISTNNGFLKEFMRAWLFGHLVLYLIGFIEQETLMNVKLRKEDCIQDFEVLKSPKHVVPYLWEFFNCSIHMLFCI